MVAASGRAARETRSWSRWATVVAGSILSMLLARDAAANCQDGSTAQTVTAGQALTQIIESSTPPCTLNVGPGTYDGAPTSQTGDSIFRISSSITIRSTNGPAATTLRVSPSKFAAVIVQALNGRCPSGAILEGFTLTGGLWGIYASASQPGCASNLITGITLRGLVVNSDWTNPSGGHGINFFAVQNSVIDSCIVSPVRANGIYLESSHNNIVMNNTIANTVVGHAIAVQGSNDNVIVANRINGSAYDGILLNSAAGPSLSGSGSSRNRIERNTISGHQVDGITITDGSSFNYVGMNSAFSSSYHPTLKPTPNPTAGVGIWVNNASNGNYLFGNHLSGSPENGIDVLVSSSTYIQANTVLANLQGGIWVANHLFYGDPASPVPHDTVIQSNNVYFNTQNAQIHVQGAIDVDVAYNYLSGDQSGTLAGANTGGVFIHEGGLPQRANVGSGSVKLYENTITDVNARALVYGTTTNTVFFRNRFLNGSNNPFAPAGRQGLTYSFAPAGVQWDGSRFLGGNHWSEFSVANGNPDSAHWYRGFVYDSVHGPDGNGPYADMVPYQSEHLGAPWATYSVQTIEPVAGSVLAAGTQKTIRWVARGCVQVNIYYGSGGTPLQPVVLGHPNIGHFFWTVPAVAFRSDYYVEFRCLDSNGITVAPFVESARFTIASSDLVLLNPGRGFRAVNGNVVRVAWKKLTGGPVNIFIKSGAGGETQVATNAAGSFSDITLPGAVSNSSRVTIRIQDSGNSNNQDSVDGYFMVRGGTPSFTTALTGLTLQMGAIQLLAWSGPSNSYTVDVDIYEYNAFSRAIVKNLPDFGNYTWFVPEMWSPHSTIHLTFKNESGVVVGQVDSGIFRVFYTTAPGAAVNRYRLYSPYTLEHLFTTDFNEYTVLGQTGAWIQEGAASRMHNGPVNVSGVEGVPYYRLYDYISRWHHWTTDRNEYFTLRQFTYRYIAEGVDGYIFPSQVAGTVPWYRLTLPSIPGLHHWTTDLNERNTLIQWGWVEEQREYVFP